MVGMKALILILPLVSVLSTSQPLSELPVDHVSGKAVATDGDSLRIGERRIRLFGIDAVEAGQRCDYRGEIWKCGRASKMALKRIVRGKQVDCDVVDMDRGRYVARCKVDEIDIAEDQVRRGWAVAYRQFSRDYVSAENEAWAAKRGLWRGSFERPHDYRARLRREAAQRAGQQKPPSTDCDIKGNISRSGARIYHMRGQVDYDRTSINESRGEMWFCTPSAAENAGWRRAAR